MIGCTARDIVIGSRESLLALLRFLRARYDLEYLFEKKLLESSVTSAGALDDAVAQGLARKLVLSPDSSDRNLVMVQGSGWFDLARSRALWEQFDGPAALVRRNDWVDRPSLSSVYAYVLGGVELAEVMQFRGDSAGASRVRGQVRAVARAARVPGEF